MDEDNLLVSIIAGKRELPLPWSFVLLDLSFCPYWIVVYLKLHDKRFYWPFLTRNLLEPLLIDNWKISKFIKMMLLYYLHVAPV